MKNYLKSSLLRNCLLLVALSTPACLFAQEDEMKIKLDLAIEDSVRVCNAIVTDADSKPLSGVSVNFYIKRSVGLLPIARMENTDENGAASAAFPSKIPGDSLGNVTVIASLEDDDAIADQKIIAWGTKTVYTNHLDQRSLWASRSNAPTYLIIASNTIILGIWGTAGYILYMLFFKMKKSGFNYNPKQK